MRGATLAKWALCAAATGLTATACGGGGGASAGVVSASWGDPQNPLEPANTNEVQGGKVLEMLFRGLKRYNPKTGAAENVIADRIETTDSQHFTVTLKDGWTFSNGEKVTAHSFVDAWNYGALLTNKQKNAPFFQYIDGFAKVHPDSGTPTAKDAVGAGGEGRADLYRHAQPEVLQLAGHPGVHGLHAAAAGLLPGPCRMAAKAGGQRAVPRGLL